jgi:hydroxypyruvate isomerase
MLLTNALDADGRVVCPYSDIAPEDKKDNCVRAFSALAPLAAESGIRLLLEPLNTVVDHPGYWLDDAGRAFEIIREVESPHLRVLYDLYHMQTMGRNVRRDIEGNLDAIGYFHAADVPGRHEPGTGTMDYAGILALLDESGYEGTFGFEFTPMRSSEEALLAIYDLVEPHL